MSDLRTETFEQHYRRAFQGIRTALIDVLGAIGADPSTPQDVARNFGLNRGLTWKVARIVGASDPFEAYPQIPGSAAITILLKACKKAGAEEHVLERVRSAFAEFERMVELHAGDRATLELMIDNAVPDDGRGELMERSRKLAFRGNSGIRGLQAKARIRTTVLAPNADDPALLDVAQVSGMSRLRRLRSNAQWPLFFKSDFNDDGSPLANRPSPIFPGAAGEDFLLTEFCTLPLPEIRVVSFERGQVHELGDGPVGNSAAMDLFYGSVSRGFATRYRDEVNDFGECFADINAPVETVLMDIALHEDLDREVQLEAKLFQGEESRPSFGRRAVELPCPEPLRALGSLSHGAATPHMPRYQSMLETVFRQLDFDPARFRMHRIELKYPPLPSVLMVRFPLSDRP